jgi:hypothetical protein
MSQGNWNLKDKSMEVQCSLLSIDNVYITDIIVALNPIVHQLT